MFNNVYNYIFLRFFLFILRWFIQSTIVNKPWKGIEKCNASNEKKLISSREFFIIFALHSTLMLFALTSLELLFTMNTFFFIPICQPSRSSALSFACLMEGIFYIFCCFYTMDQVDFYFRFLQRHDELSTFPIEQRMKNPCQGKIFRADFRLAHAI